MSKGTSARATILGRMGKDIEVKQLKKGSVGNFSVAVNQGWGDNQTTSWFNIVVYNEKKIEILQSYTEKGSRVLVEGELRIRKFTTNSGEERYATEIVVAYDGIIEIVDGKKDDAGATGGSSRSRQSPASPAFDPDLDDDVPFISLSNQRVSTRGGRVF